MLLQAHTANMTWNRGFAADNLLCCAEGRRSHARKHGRRGGRKRQKSVVFRTEAEREREKDGR